MQEKSEAYLGPCHMEWWFYFHKKALSDMFKRIVDMPQDVIVCLKEARLPSYQPMFHLCRNPVVGFY